MSDEELRAAAEMITGTPSTGSSWAAEPGKLISAAYKLAHAYFAANPADGGEPIDGTWLRAIGGIRPMAVASDTVYCFGEWSGGYYPLELYLVYRDEDGRRNHDPHQWIVHVGPTKLANEHPTRADVRTLLRAMGVELKERKP